MRVDLHDGIFVVVQSFSHVHLFETPWTAAHQASLSFTISWCLLKFMSIELVMLPTILSSVFPLSSFFSLSQHQGLFQCVSSSHQVAKVLELPHQSFLEYSGLISFRIDWLDLLAIQGTLKSLLQHHNWKALWQYLLFSEPFERHRALYLLISQCVFPKKRIFSYRATVRQSNSRNLTLLQ